MEPLEQIHEIVAELRDDSSIPKNVISKLENMGSILEEGTNLHIQVDKAIQLIDELLEDSNLQPFIRTRLWNISSLLESI